MRKLGTSMLMAAVLAVASGPSLVDAQSGCRSECERLLRQCRQDCAGADDPGECMKDCQSMHQQCLANCQ